MPCRLVPEKEPPTFEHTEKWPTEMLDFTSACLQKNPDDRPLSMELMNVSISGFVVIDHI